MVETKLTPLYVKTAAQKFDFKTIFLLDIQRKGVTSIGAIPECINLVTLDLSRNNLSNISGLEKCIQLKVLNLSYNKLLSVSVLHPLSELQRLEIQGNKIPDLKGLMPSETLEILYLQEFDMTGANPICQMGKSTYKMELNKMFPKLKALDGNRKATGETINFKEALPVEQDENVSYKVEHVEWFDRKALEMKNPAAGKFEDSMDVKRDENALQLLLSDCKTLLAKKSNVLQL